MHSDWLIDAIITSIHHQYSSRNSFSNLKQHYSAALGLGALLEEALYKCLE